MSIFKAYDIRGTYPDQLNEDMAYRIGRAYVAFVGVGKVMVGRDCRLSSDGLFRSLAKGLMEQGADVIDVGLCTSPMFYFGLDKDAGGIMITASHNPASYNGFKLLRPGVIPISGSNGIPDIQAIVEKRTFPEPTRKGTMNKEAIQKRYHDFLLKKINTQFSFNVAIDCANAMSVLDLPLFKKTGCKVKALFNTLDGRFPNHEADPLKAENTVKLVASMKGQDLGITFDGDADRVIFIDEKGNRVPADLITALLGQRILLRNKGEKVLYEVRSSRSVPEVIKESGGIPILTRAGHSFIKQNMRKENAIFGGELSGHYFFRELSYTDNAAYASLQVLLAMKETGKPMSELIKPLHRYYASPEINFTVEDKDAKMRLVKARFPKATSFEVDGVSLVSDDWWCNVRPSNTEPLLRLCVEARTTEKRDEMVRKISALLSS
ncbi:MAG: phosphomannomutase/phosphoglucomutase [Nanoarchaeota archaeon]